MKEKTNTFEQGLIPYQPVKRLMDIILVVVLSIIFFPIWILVPLLLKLTGGPVFYKHRRVGKNGEEFWLYKFRTMVPNADKVLREDKELWEKFKKHDWKLEDDPRITPLGRLLRNLTIDEFPQLWDVLKGDMSIVGPRAYVRKELEEQTEKYPQTEEWVEEILKIKPGITGPWQTSGRNEIPFVKRAKMDYKYAKGHSLWWDIKILLKTPPAMISKW
jgi:lipopolysaccharide/colanic/teichoic acid biosynthesis glycosyltransferase